MYCGVSCAKEYAEIKKKRKNVTTPERSNEKKKEFVIPNLIRNLILLNKADPEINSG
jgi:hypothetical protein